MISVIQSNKNILFFILTAALLVSCGFHLQGRMHLALPLQRLYLQVPDSYGQLARTLRQYLNMSHVQLVASPKEATTVLNILRDDASQQLLSVSSTEQTRQYNLIITVVFEITDSQGHIIVSPQTLTESKPITIQSDQILGGSNEANLFFQQMRRTIAYAIMNRIASKEINALINTAFARPKPAHL